VIEDQITSIRYAEMITRISLDLIPPSPIDKAAQPSPAMPESVSEYSRTCIYLRHDNARYSADSDVRRPCRAVRAAAQIGLVPLRSAAAGSVAI
jgi:hypothetical protein